jgi:hypothetical protein
MIGELVFKISVAVYVGCIWSLQCESYRFKSPLLSFTQKSLVCKCSKKPVSNPQMQYPRFTEPASIQRRKPVFNVCCVYL